ncbi:DUF4350 domain-containing protein [Desulfonema magnum]|nr:DUF4350 domain-containing protein [Desulfonema magnum]
MTNHESQITNHESQITNHKILILFLLIIFSVFMIGMVRLFALRFETGDVYPKYSSLRSDPLGTRGFYESLENLEYVSVGRNFLRLSDMRPEQDTTIFYLGINVYQMKSADELSLRHFEEIAAEGGRVIFSFFPVKRRGFTKKLKKISSLPLADRWGINFSRFEPDEKPDTIKKAQKVLPEKDLPYSLSWHTALYFEELANPWKVIYECDGHPVIIEKQFGRGSIVFSADSYLFSNEALQKERYPALLLWFMGKNTRVIFDESHLGLREQPGVAGLARKYGLQGLFWGILLLAGLFVWKNSTYFVPPPDDDALTDDYDFASEKDTTEGMVSLLRRNIPPAEILGVCVKEWEKSLNPGRELPNEKLEQIKALTDKDPVRGYQDICQILSKK